MNKVAEAENFTDAGEMWRYAFDDDDFTITVDRIWTEIKPLYDILHRYVKVKLKAIYKDELKEDDNLIPAHLLGNYQRFILFNVQNLIGVISKNIKGI